MKNRYLFLLISVIVIILVTYHLKSDYDKSFLKETKEEMIIMHEERDSIFSFVDETMSSLDVERKEKQLMLDSLDKELELKQIIADSYLRSIEKSVSIKAELEEINENLLLEKNNLDSILKETKFKLKEVMDVNEVTRRKLETVNKEKENIMNQYSDLKQIYKDNTFIVVDTIYKIDTIYYSKDDIKKLVLRNRGE